MLKATDIENFNFVQREQKSAGKSQAPASSGRSVSTNHSSTRQTVAGRKESPDKRNPTSSTNGVTFISNKPKKIELPKMDMKELFAKKRVSNCRSEGKLDDVCAAFNADILKIDEFIARQGPVVEVDCFSDSAASPTKLRSDSLMETCGKAFLTEGAVSARSASSHNRSLSTAENRELIDGLK